MTSDDEDRKILEVATNLLGYLEREIGQLQTPRPELVKAIATAALLSAASLDPEGAAASPAAARRRLGGAYE